MLVARSDPDRTLPIELTLEESAWLLHAMMANDVFRDSVLREATTLSPPLQRMTALYQRLSDLNDALMGKNLKERLMTDEKQPWEGRPTGSTCDVCRQPILTGEPVYGLAWSEDGTVGRHWKCHKSTDEVFGELRESIRKLEGAARRVDDAMRRGRK